MIAAVRWPIREHGGEPSSRQVAELLDERNAYCSAERPARERHLQIVPPKPQSRLRGDRGDFPEPADGSVVRFVKSGYGYVGMRCGDYWETSATQSVGFVDEVMSWNEMWCSGRCFELAIAMDPVRRPAERDKRLVEESVVCFTIADQNWAAIAYQGAYTGFKNRLSFRGRRR